MREHMGLYRGKRIDNGEWVEGSLFVSDNGECEICFGTPRIRITYNVYPNTIGECTGLRDKNGKLIFEGDIVRIRERGYTENGIIVFANDYPGGWLVASMHSTSKCSLPMRTDVEIIGNVHDNPELLKGGEG